MIPRAMLAVAYATGRASHARQVKGDDPDKKGYPGPPQPHTVKNSYYETLTGMMLPLAGRVAEACECGNEPSGSIKCGEFLD
jgi:hypothetical protein